MAEFLRAREAVRSIGTNAIPFYVKWISEQPSAIAQVRNYVAGKLQKDFRDRNLAVAKGTFVALPFLATGSESIVPHLIRLIKTTRNPTTLHDATRCTASIGKTAAKYYVALFQSAEPRVRLVAAEEAWRFGGTPEVVEGLEMLLHDSDENVKRTAGKSLNWIHLHPDGRLEI